MEGGELTLEVLEKNFPNSSRWNNVTEFLEWFLEQGEDAKGQFYIGLDDGNYFVATITQEVVRKLLEEGKE
ncbi:MAG: hypothetical protein ACW99G_07925 [Candidatus Thorarchaeota archaeon]|jgi:hypothetical protein